jgi:hypothetical protein
VLRNVVLISSKLAECKEIVSSVGNITRRCESKPTTGKSPLARLEKPARNGGLESN